jgi:lipid-binding SYLF domain-containing protein
MFAGMKVAGIAVVCGAACALSACDTAPKNEADKNALTAQGSGALSAFENTDSTLNTLVGKSVGYAIFPSVGKAGFIAGGAYGRGTVYEGGRMIGWADISQGTVGLQIGAQSYDELIIFLTQDQLNKFKSNEFAFSANASAVAIKPGVASAADTSKGVVVFVKPTGGAMAEASIGGQRFTFQAK